MAVSLTWLPAVCEKEFLCPVKIDFLCSPVLDLRAVDMVFLTRRSQKKILSQGKQFFFKFLQVLVLSRRNATTAFLNISFCRIK